MNSTTRSQPPRNPRTSTGTTRGWLHACLRVTLTGLAVIAAGCVTLSLHPWHLVGDLVRAPGLEGEWQPTSADEGSRLHFKRDGDGFHLDIQESADKPPVRYRAHAFALAGAEFLDLVRQTGDVEAIPGHMIMKLDRREQSIRLISLKHDWVEETLTAKPRLLAHHWVTPDSTKPDERGLVLTAGTRQLQRFLSAHLSTPAAWGDTNTYRRNTTSRPAAP